MRKNKRKTKFCRFCLKNGKLTQVDFKTDVGWCIECKETSMAVTPEDASGYILEEIKTYERLDFNLTTLMGWD